MRSDAICPHFGKGHACELDFLEIPAAKDFLARRGPGHRILAGIAHLCHVRFYAGLDPVFAGLNAGAELLDIAGAEFVRLLVQQRRNPRATALSI